MKNNSTLFWVLTLVFLIAGGWMISQVIQHTLDYKNLKEVFTEALNYEQRLLDAAEWFDTKVGEAKKEAVAQSLVDANKHYDLAAKVSWFFLLACIIYGGITLLFFNKSKTGNYRAISIGMLSIALLCLIAGVFTPMLEIAAFEKDMTIPLDINTGFMNMKINHTAEFPGEIYFYYQSKSIMELISLLLQNGNMLVGLSILAFSILVPFTKIFLSAMLLFKGSANESASSNKIIQYIGKWSMADVFVVAIFLGFLAFKNMQTGIQTDSHTLIGLYYFFGYCIISISSGYLIKKYLANKSIA